MIAPLVSVVIPCYRQGHLLPAAIASVRAQSYGAIETIVVNDGSDDCTDAVARQHLPQITYVSKSNGGLSSARNAGIDIARGDYFLFLDADDMIHPQAIEWMVAKTTFSDHPIVRVGYQRFTNDPTRDAGNPVFSDAIEDLFPSILSRCFPIHCHLVPRQIVTAAGGFDITLPANEDLDFWLRCALFHPSVKVIPTVGAFYRITPGAMNRNRRLIVESGTEVILRFARRVTTSSPFLSAHGSDLLLALYSYRRRLVARGGDAAREAQLTNEINVLHKNGIRVRSSLIRQLFDLLPHHLQRATDWATCGLLQIVRPRLAAAIRGDIQGD